MAAVVVLQAIGGVLNAGDLMLRPYGFDAISNG
jgi:hypothetical protein